MDAVAIVSFTLAGACALASIAITIQLARGSWLALVAGRGVIDADEAKREKARASGRRMAFVTGTLAVLLITMIVYKAAALQGNADVESVGLALNNIAFVAFVVALVAFYVMQRAYKDPLLASKSTDGSSSTTEEARLERRAQKAKIDAFPTAMLVFLVGVVVAAFGLGVLFSLI